MKKTKKLQKIIASTVFQRNTPANALLSVGSQQVASFTPLNFHNPAKLTGVATPTRDTDVVPLQYLQTHYLSKNDPNPGYLPIKGGSMTGNINMGTHSIFNLKQPTPPTIPPPASNKPEDPRKQDGFKDKPTAEQDQEIAEYNTKLAEYQKEIDDYNAAWQAFYSEAATVKYVKNIVTEITSNPNLEPAINSATEVEKKIDLAHKTLGIEITQNPDAPDPTTISNTGASTTPNPTGTTAPSTGPANPDTPSYENLPSIIKKSLFVLTQSDNTLQKDLKMTNAQISNIKTPADSGEENHAANVEYLNSKLQPPKRAFISHTLPTPNSTPISPNGYIPWLSTTTGGSSTTTEPEFKSSLADQCLQAKQDHLEIKTPGLLVLSVRGSWNTTASGGGGNTQTPETFPISLTVTPDPTTGGSGSPGSSTTTTTTLTLPLKLHSGESVMLQLPITETSKVKIATNTPSSGGGGSGNTSAPANLSSWSWEAALFPTDVTTKTTTPTTPPAPAPAPAPSPAP
ncbi:hypothetical protein [Chlamydia suis]|uniref:hypothetical protein n=1 Tax=Chlamydia suis TaxID=83559 RepID=UPI0009B0D6F6|nr:hypothetical protein [Chlamydia suis]